MAFGQQLLLGADIGRNRVRCTKGCDVESTTGAVAVGLREFGFMARADLEAAGFGTVSAEKLLLPERSRAKSPQEAAIANCHGGILRTHIERHAPGRLEEITNAVADALAEKFGAGPIDAPMQAILFTASR